VKDRVKNFPVRSTVLSPTPELRLQAHRELHQRTILPDLLPQLIGHAVMVRAHPVQLVNKRHKGHPVAPHLPVHGQRLRLNASDRAQHQHGAVQHAQCPLHLEMFTNKRCFYFISFSILSKCKKCAPNVHNKVLAN